MNSTIRLFKALPITKKGKAKASKPLLKMTVAKGFIFSPEVVCNFNESDLVKLIDVISKEYGLEAKALNATFHKSWKKIKNASIEQLVLEQILHYITTYGYESLGVYDQDSVFIPTEKLEIPKIDVAKIPLTVIRGYTKDELKSKLVEFLSLGVALKDDTKKDVIDIATFVKLTQKEICEIKNKEVKTALFDYLGLIPENPVEFLRYMIYKSTNKTLIIKSPGLICEIKSKDNLAVLGVLEKYSNQYGLERLAEIFYRFKPLFLAFRTSKRLKVLINRLRKLATSNHKPMPEDYLNNVTNKIATDSKLNAIQFNKELSKANTFRKIRLAYALKFRCEKRDSIMYRIRNGKSYATKFNFDKTNEASKALKVVLNSISGDISKNVLGKSVYIPKAINYALPATEKQFTGDVPSGSYVVVPKNLVIGVHWENLPRHRIDLDLSLMSLGNKFGWDGLYRSSNSDVFFSGDVTDAPKPNGASEFFYIEKQTDKSYLLMLNNFTYGWNGGEATEVPFKLIVASEVVSNMNRNYMVDPNKVVCVINSKITDKQKTLGLLVVTPEENRFYFAETTIGNTISSYNNDYTEHSRKFLLDYYRNTVNLKELLEQAGAKITNDPEKCDINLAPESIQRDTILNLFK